MGRPAPPTRSARQNLRAQVLDYAAKTTLRQAATYYGVDYATVRAWACRARIAAGANPTPTEAARDANEFTPPPVDVAQVEVLDIPAPPAPITHVVRPDFGPPNPGLDLTPRDAPPEVAIGNAFAACARRIERAADHATMKDVISALKVLGEIVLAANVTSTPLALKAALDELEPGDG
jgi:hypothetical protein